MLRSYQYTEKSYLDYSMQDSAFQAKEMDIVQRYVKNNHKRDDLRRDCPICGEDTGRYFFTKWGVDYLLCKKCKSIFAVCSQEDVESYLRYQELIDFRTSVSYERQMTEKRQAVWKEFLEWLEVRSFRFLHKNHDLHVVDVGNRFVGFVESIKVSPICGKYELRNSDLKMETGKIGRQAADIVLCNDVLKTEYQPQKLLTEIKESLKPTGLLVIGARVGNGFDILTLKEKNTRICPYEHIFLPSVKGISKLLKDNGFDLLEITSAGVMDVKYVLDDAGDFEGQDGFVQYLLKETDETVLHEFQRFLQKSCMSSYVRVIARKTKGMP